MDERLLLADFIYQVHYTYSFTGKKKSWSSPTTAFSASGEGSIRQQLPEFIDSLENKKVLREEIEDLICVLADWKRVAEGIYFTTKAIYIDTPKNKKKYFRVRYDDIVELDHSWGSNTLEIVDYYGKAFKITTPLWDAYTIKVFLEFASERYAYEDYELDTISDIKLPNLEDIRIGDVIAGTVYSNISNASTLYGEDKFQTPRGHGFAAERANHLYDTLTGRDASILGDDNAKGGADRLVDGVHIQSKYCATGGKCISECFKDGKFRYYHEGKPMQIEVPSDKYEAALQAMEERIRRGQIIGVTDPKEASNIVRKGHFTYKQVQNIAKGGNLDSLLYDAGNGVIVGATVFGITTVLSFAVSVWDGEDKDIALKNAASSGLKVGGTSFLTNVISGQLSKLGLNSLLVGSSEAVIKVLGPKASAVLVNALRTGKNIYGAAAMKSAAKLLRTNVITSAVSMVVLSTGDIVRIFQSKISGKQLFKNITKTGASLAGGTAGWTGGAALGAKIGTFISPGIGTAVGTTIGGLLGAFGGGSAAGGVTGAIMDEFIEDDATAMVDIIQEEFIIIAQDYLLNQREVEHVVDHLGESLTAKELQEMYASDKRKKFARGLIMPHVEVELERREKITGFEIEDLQHGLRLVLEDIADNDMELALV